ncbi:TatD family hydrolase [Anaeromicropila populeti]|uniref:TatD DNase family protein n=1 Tax=Anaeromicropila populeti TaxID=37658 RepID=A0A1I6LFX6_9FIRM|nr:TatD family hydrolase [Anaeromicropila populeti]SFS02322.1 TatD DNase family protein [Anaeromicropila populeti]
MIVDSHAHYEDERFNEDREELLKSLYENGIELVVNVASSMETIKKTVELTEKFDFVYGAVGAHPEECANLSEQDIEIIKENSKKEKIMAIGEIGLDYYWDEPERIIQKKWFERQLDLAREVNLPVIIHSRDAAQDTLSIMKEKKADQIGGVVHCFSYGVEMAREYLNMGFYLGIGGVITFSNGKKLKEVVQYAPLESLVLETDCPYLSPVPNRGKRNSSLNLIYVAEEIAKIKNIDCDTVINVTTRNSKQMYGLKL